MDSGHNERRVELVESVVRGKFQKKIRLNWIFIPIEMVGSNSGGEGCSIF